MARLNSNSNSNSARGFSLIELLIVVAIILIIAAIAIPNFLRARMAANEAAAANTVRTITSAAVVYNSTWGNNYPPDLQSLGGVSITASCDKANLLDPILTVPPFRKSGYIYAYNGVNAPGPTAPGCTSPGFFEYLITASPDSIGTTGQRSFCSDQPGVIHFDPNGLTPASVAACIALPEL